MTKRPQQRQRKEDRLIHQGATTAEIATDFALAPLEAATRSMDAIWGIDRLPELVSADTLQKYAFSVGKLNEAYNAADPKDTAAWAAVCIRGLNAMDAEARRLGHSPAPADVLQFVHEGTRYGIIKRVEDWPPIAAAFPDLTLVSLVEVGNALALYRQGTVLAAAHAAFPGAVVTASRPLTALEQEIGDEIPW